MAAEPNNLHLCMDADARLAAAAGAVARFLGDAAGLETAAVSQLQSAVIAACEEAFKHLTAAHPHLEVAFVRFPDRIEVVLSHKGDSAPAVRPDVIAGFRGRKGGDSSSPGTLTGVDRVQRETHGAEVVTRLTKFLGKVAPSL